MHSMPKTADDTSSTTQPVYPTFGPPRKVTRKPRVDAVLVEAVDTAKTALTEFYVAEDIGDHLGTSADDERVVTHRFASKVPGYDGWELFATLARAPRSKRVTVCETGMLPGDEAILAPDWVPWMERASEEERIRLDAIAAGEDPAKALEAAGFGKKTVTEETSTDEHTSAQQPDIDKKLARREAKRQRIRRQAARRRKRRTETTGRDDKKTTQ